jgi:hypothetical protein
VPRSLRPLTRRPGAQTAVAPAVALRESLPRYGVMLPVHDRTQQDRASKGYRGGCPWPALAAVPRCQGSDPAPPVRGTNRSVQQRYHCQGSALSWSEQSVFHSVIVAIRRQYRSTVAVRPGYRSADAGSSEREDRDRD